MWYGVQADDQGRVTEVRLDDNGLRGTLPPELGSLDRLRTLDLSLNVLSGPIPPELGSLAGLEQLSLQRTKGLSGPIPAELGSLVRLRQLWLGGNRLSGPIPPELRSLHNLRDVSLWGNRLTGPIPPELGSLRSLWALDLRSNRMTGPIPPQLGSASSLQQIFLADNHLTGPVPPELADLQDLWVLHLDGNQLTGPIPRTLLDGPPLLRFRFHGNGIGGGNALCAPGTREFVTWLEGMEEAEGPFCNAADMSVLKALYESTGGDGWTDRGGWLGGPVLDEWYGVTADTLGRVTALDLSRNGLAGRLPASLAALTHMTELRIADNAELSGRLPLALADLALRALHYAGTDLCAPVNTSFRDWLSTIPSHDGTGADCPPLSDREILEALFEATDGPNWDEDENWLTDLPLDEWHGVGVDGHGSVVSINLFDNNLTGQIPAELGSFEDLEALVFGKDELSGRVPVTLGDLANLRELALVETGLSGEIPPELGNLSNLEELWLYDNQLSGAIPPELGSLGDLELLAVDNNALSGAIPPELGDLRSLQMWWLHDNALSGAIPADLGRLGNLRKLYAQDNALEGPLPPEFGALSVLEELALSGNAGLSGALPPALTNLRNLEAFVAHDTGLCAPSGPGFLQWLERVPNQRVKLCSEAGEPPMAYLVQAVQSREWPVPLVAGEEALLRVFVTAGRDNRERLPHVRASFYVGGSLVHVADISGKPGPIPTGVQEGALEASANAVIPAEAVRPGLELVVEIDPDGTLDPSLGVQKRIPESGRLAIDVRVVPLFDLTLVPFLWTEAPDLAILESVAAAVEDPEYWLWRGAPYLPVGDLEVRAHEPVMSSSNNTWDLLSETFAIRAMEGGTGYYMGTMSPPVKGAVGIAPIGYKALFSLLPGPTAHELGHSFSLYHAPCGGAGGPDPAYPYLGGRIGAWGYDPRTGTLVSPQETDLMTYCDGWISDYHYAKALRHRILNDGAGSAAAIAPATSLLIWGGMDADGAPHLEPTFVVNAPAALPDSAGAHRVTGRSDSGDVLFSFSFAMPEVADGDGGSAFAFVLPARADWASGLATITLTGPGGAATLDRETERPMAILRDPRDGRVRGFLRDLPPATRAAADAVGIGAGTDFEVFFSRGIPDVAAWSR